MPKILITVDLEDWFQVENLRSIFPHDTWDECELRVVESTKRLLELFESYNVRATFFVLGWLAERLPELIRLIHEKGHEIASHGYNHVLCYELDDLELLRDIEKSKKILEGITSERVYGYRAPSFSINKILVRTLETLGFIYDSSFNDFNVHGRYGSLEGDWQIVKPGLLKNKKGLFELPISNLKFLGKTIPWGGGGYFRLIPLSIFNRGVKNILKKQGSYLFYCHPWEFDSKQPRVNSLCMNHRFRHYVGINRNLEKLNSFLNAFADNRFITCSQLVN